MFSVFVCLASLFISQVLGHGMVIDPPNRSSMWRYGYDQYPPNYDDDGLDCGGFGEQWDINGGKCGLCGDDYRMTQPRANEHGGKYGLGVISGTYVLGSILNVTVQLTTSHLGYFEFSICNMDNSGESEECFDANKLLFVDGTSRFKVKSNDQSKKYNLQLQLPQTLQCKHCVLRWHYKTGNSWGVCDDGSEAMGCGEQETFRTCSDIAIKSNVQQLKNKENQSPVNQITKVTSHKVAHEKSGHVKELESRLPAHELLKQKMSAVKKIIFQGRKN